MTSHSEISISSSLIHFVPFNRLTFLCFLISNMFYHVVIKYVKLHQCHQYYLNQRKQQRKLNNYNHLLTFFLCELVRQSKCRKIRNSVFKFGTAG